MKRSGFFIRLLASLLDVFIVNLLAILGLVGGTFFLMKLGWVTKANIESLRYLKNVGSNISSEQILVALNLAPPSLKLLLLILTVCLALYHLTEVLFAATPGKMMLGIRIRKADGNPATSIQLLVRFILKYSGSFVWILSLIPGLAVLEPTSSVVNLIVFLGLFLALTPSKQALYDKLVRTAVYPARAHYSVSAGSNEKLTEQLLKRQERQSTAPDPADLFKPRW